MMERHINPNKSEASLAYQLKKLLLADKIKSAWIYHIHWYVNNEFILSICLYVNCLINCHLVQFISIVFHNFFATTLHPIPRPCGLWIITIILSMKQIWGPLTYFIFFFPSTFNLSHCVVLVMSVYIDVLQVWYGLNIIWTIFVAYMREEIPHTFWIILHSISNVWFYYK